MSRFCRLVELCVRQPEFVICWGSQGGEWQHWTIKLVAVHHCCARLNNIMGIWGVGQGWPAATAFVTVIGEYSECYSCTAPLYSDWTYILVLAKPAALSQSYCDEGFNHEGLCNGQGGRRQGVRRVRER